MDLGAKITAAGTSFALYSKSAEAVTLCLAANGEEQEHICARDGDIWRVFVPEARAGQRYAWLIASRRLRCPYGKAFDGEWALLLDESFDWGQDRLPRTPLAQTLIYETHVRGFTQQHAAVPVEQRGTYLGLTDPGVIAHLKKIGVTAVELLPIAELVDEPALVARGLCNYWGYNPIGYFAPAARYRASHTPGDEVREFKAMVKALHAAGLEVYLDVVYNHTAEGEAQLPALSFRGIDNRSYYRFNPDGSLVNHTGCGNTLDASQPAVQALVLDSLRYWAEVMHVDGFRFDLATVLGRQTPGSASDAFNRHAPLLEAIRNDSVLSQRKLIAEPWDSHTYQLGNFPAPFYEWNDRFRDHARRFWRQEPLVARPLAEALSGNLPRSLDFVTAHDGFCLLDLVSYEHKHNLANGEDNRDGTDENHSSNHGEEGPSPSPAVNAARLTQRKNLLATLFFSRGVPMLLGGDEIGRTQNGNNNAYCQDNATSWYDWQHQDNAFAAFVARLASARRQLDRSGPVSLLRYDGAAMSEDDWNNSITMSFALRFGDASFVAFNASPVALDFVLPPGEWDVLIDTVNDDKRVQTRQTIVGAASLQALQRRA